MVRELQSVSGGAGRTLLGNFWNVIPKLHRKQNGESSSSNYLRIKRLLLTKIVDFPGVDFPLDTDCSGLPIDLNIKYPSIFPPTYPSKS